MPKEDLHSLQEELRQSYWVPPTHVEAAPMVVAEVRQLSEHPIVKSPGVVANYGEYIAHLEGGSKHDLATEFATPLKRADLGETGGVVAHDIQPLGARTVRLSAVEQQPGQIIGAVTFATTSEYYQILTMPDGRPVIARVDQDGQIVRPEFATSGSGAMYRTLRGTVSVSKAGTAGQLRIDYHDTSLSQPAGASLAVAEQTQLEEVKRVAAERERKEKLRLQKPLLQSAMAGVALWSVVVPGGLTDLAMDPFADTHATVAHAIEMIPILDGATGVIGREANQRAEAALTQTMSDLDEHRYGAIAERAEQYQRSHAEFFMPAEQRSAVLQELQSARTLAEAQAALQKVGDFYGETFIVSERASLDAVTYTGCEIIRALTRLPRNLTQEAALVTIHIETGEEAKSERHATDERAFYRPSEQAIYMIAQTQFDDTMKVVTATVAGGSGGYGVQEVFLHEFGHALDHGNSRLTVADREQLGDAASGGTWLRDTMLRTLSASETISSYARTNPGENKAENLSGIFSDRIDGLAHPDEVRKFQSRANQTMLANLGAQEAFDPGLANYLVAINSRLMGGNTLTS